MLQKNYDRFVRFIKTSVFIVLFVSMALGFHGTAFALDGSSITALTNAQRGAAGLAPLSWNYTLANSAAMKAQDMCAKDYWAHNSPDGLTPWSFIAAAGYPYISAGENLAEGYSTDSDVVSAWMASPSHRANILNGNFQDVGVAMQTCTLQGQYVTVVVAHYGQSSYAAAAAPVAQPATPVATATPAPAPVQTFSPSSSTPGTPVPTVDPSAPKPMTTQPRTHAKTLKKHIIMRNPFETFMAQIITTAKKYQMSGMLTSQAPQASHVGDRQFWSSLNETSFKQTVNGMRDGFSS